MFQNSPLSANPEAPCIAAGKFLSVGGEKFYVRGITYGTFRPDGAGNEYTDAARLESDFAQMAAAGFNAIRLYSPPPRRLLDVAQRHGLRVMVGLSAEQHVGLLEDKKASFRAIETLVRGKVRACADHPALLCYALGNEIPASIARWRGRRWVERYLEELYWCVKAEDPDGLITYVNYPSTEYLDLSFLDLVCFNVYLESQERLESYLARVQNLAGERPLLLGEVGLDSMRNGEESQAWSLAWQIRTAFGAGCAGAFVYSWTDEWYRGGSDVYDWAFGVTDRRRRPKPALAAVRAAFAEAPFKPEARWPRISVVVCSHNGARTIRDCCDGLLKLDYPDYEVIVVDDGSTDATAAVARTYGFRLISTENQGLSNARNTGLAAATGEIVAYIDDDAWPDPHWLSYLATTFLTSSHAGVGGPNIAPSGDGFAADCVARAPGGPVHVLLSDQEAEHLPGCNMAFRTDCLRAIGGFDPQFRVAGDDVDVCWRIRQRGWTLGFHPGAMVWHHRRSSLRAYWRQQVGYGKAEAMLERKWPEKYNGSGQLTWAGRLYGRGLPYALATRRGRVYHGPWGSAPFQLLYQPREASFLFVTLLPEWYLFIGFLAVFALLGLSWKPLLVVAAPLLVASVLLTVVQAVLGAAKYRLSGAARSGGAQKRSLAVTALLHLAQPLARLRGRLLNGLAPWRLSAVSGLVFPRPRKSSFWSADWLSPESRLQAILARLSAAGARVRPSGDYDRWDLEVRGGLLGAARLLMATENVGSGQVVRIRVWPRCSPAGLAFLGLLSGLAIAATAVGAWGDAVVLGACGALVAFRTLLDCAAAVSAFSGSMEPAEKAGA